MFFYDKDMERMMQLKKQEIMREMETAKKRILEELNCVKRSVHTDFCDLLADYNRIDFQMKQLLATFKEEIAKLTTGYSDLISLKFAEYNDMVVDKVEQLEILEREIELFFSNKLAELEAMQTTVQGLIDKVGEIESTAITQEIFQQTIAQLLQLMQDAHNTIENKFYGRIDELVSDLEYNEADHSAIRKEFADADAAIRQEFANADTAIREEMEANNAELMEQILAAQVQPDWNESDPQSKAHILNRTHYGTYSEEENAATFATADYRIEFPYKSLNTSSKHFKIPFNVASVNNGDIICVEYNGVSYDLEARRANVVAYELAFEDSGAISHIPKANAMLAGKFQIDDNTSGLETTLMKGLGPCCFAYDDDTSMYVIIHSNTEEEIPQSFKVSVKHYHAEKVLDPMYTGKNDHIGGVLVRSGDGATWKDLPFVEYSKLEVVKLKTLNLTLDKQETSWTYYEYSGNFSDLPEKGYVQFYDLFRPYSKNGSELRIDDSLYDRFKSGTLTIRTNGDEMTAISKALTDVTNITVNFYHFGEVKYGGDFTIKSPNGTVFKIVVSDDGTLSATPATTQ